MPDHTQDQSNPWQAAALRLLDIPLHRYLGLELISISKEGCTIQYTTQAQHMAISTSMHAGTLYTSLEVANVIAALPHLVGGEWMGTLRHEVSLLSGVAGEGQVIQATSRMIKRGKHVAFFESEAKNSVTGAVIARAQTIRSVADPAKQEAKL